MSVLKSQRRESQLQVYETAVQLRKDIMCDMLQLFNYKRIGNIKNPDGTDVYPEDVIEYYRGTIMELLKNITSFVSKANAVYPTTQRDIERRTVLQNCVIEESFNLRSELNCIVEVFPGCTKFFLPYADRLEKLINQTKRWKKSNKNFLKKIVD